MAKYSLSAVQILIFISRLFVIDWAAADEIDESVWYDRMRQPWEQEKTGFIRNWLVLGEFPNPPAPGDEFYNHRDPCIGCDTDYLVEYGGEASIIPEPGMKHTRPDGSISEWKTYVSDNDTIDLTDALAGRPKENTVAYAYASLSRDEEGPARLAVGSDDGVMVWVNGKAVHRNIVGRGVVPDNDIIPVHLKAGENSVLIKVEQGEYGWGFCARLLDRAAVGNDYRPDFSPSLKSEHGAATLDIQTDVVFVDDGEVAVDVMAAGGRTVASQTLVRGDRASFPTADWPDGAYEVRCIARIGLDRPKVRYFPWFKGDASFAVRELLDAGDRAEGDTPESMTLRMLAEMVRDRLGDSVDEPTVSDVNRVVQQLLEFEEVHMELKGEGSRIRSSGFLRLAYRDEVDGSPQFCRVYLPHDYTPDKKWPVVIYLHGYNPENPRYVQWWWVDQRHHDRCDRYGVIYIEPHGRANTGYRGIGEKDVLRGLDMAIEKLSVDEDRIYLTGESMGGGGTWHVGTRNPDRFAAISPVYGGWDYRDSLPQEEYESLTPYERLRQNAWSSSAHAEALLTTPTFVHHGVQDQIVDVRHSRFLVRELQQWGYPVRYAEYPAGNHFNNMGHWENLMPWLLSHTLERNPCEVRLQSFTLQEASAHWVAVEQFDNYLKPVNVHAEILGKNAILLDSENALTVRLSPGGDHIDPDQPVEVLWNGVIYSDRLNDGEIFLLAEKYDPRTLVKRPDLAGPISDVRQTPFAIIQGTSSTDPFLKKMCERVANDMIGGWEDWQKVTPRHFRDTDVTDEVLKNYSLILIGGPEANTVTESLFDVPLAINGEQVRIGSKSVGAPDSAVQLVYPSPWNSDRYVHVLASTSPEGMFHHKGISEEWDFCVHDGRVRDSEDDRPAEKVLILAGRFNRFWKVDERSLFTGVPDARERSPVPYLPTRITANIPGDHLFISDLLESRSVQSFRWMNRNANGENAPLQIDGKTYVHGLGIVPWNTPGSADWNIGEAGWNRLRGTIGVEYGPDSEVSEKDIENTKVVFKVLGNDEELFVSEPFRYGDPGRELDLSIAGVKILTLVVHNEAPWSSGPKSANWAELRLER